MELLAENVVITANQCNPSLFSQLWLVRINAAGPDDFRGTPIQTPAVSQVATRHFELLVTPDRLQFSPLGEDDATKAQTVRDTLGHIVESIPHTPYTAVGVNFTWAVFVEDRGEASRRMFLNSTGPLAQEFAVQDANFGSYFSKDMFGGRMRLNAVPAILTKDGRSMIQLGANFDRQLTGLAPDDILPAIRDTLGQWSGAKEYTRHLCSLIENAR